MVQVITYDIFSSPSGYGQEDYLKRWNNIYGPGELAVGATRSFDNTAMTVSAVPFRTSADESVFDHIKYFAVSSKTFDVPANGAVTLEASVTARTPGTEKNRVIHGSFGPAGSYPNGAPYQARVLEAQQACASIHMIDFQTGQLFDWLISENTALTLVERLPSLVTNSPMPAGIDSIYTQIIREHAIGKGPHTYGIRFWRNTKDAGVDYLLDGKVVDRIGRIGVPLDQQGVDFTGTWPSLGSGEELAGKIDSVAIAHGLFSVLDSFPFQHPDAPEHSVSVPISERLFGQGAEGRFEKFVVTTETDQ